MPTSRTFAFFVTALLLYFFANQTQVGWIYVMSALMLGVVLAAWWMGRNALKGITAERTILPSDPPHEGQPVSVSLTFNNTRADSHIRTTEHCPFADPQSESRHISVFIPAIPPKTPILLNYEANADRRGLHEYPPLQLDSPAPFGLFRRKRTIPQPTRILIYPEVKPLHRLALFDRRPSALLSRPRPGTGTELIGIRPYRSGDSTRHIHWRSVARTGQLISKEFADDSQPGLTIALDLFNYQTSQSDTKHTPFEWTVKIAASIGCYAIQRGYALHLLADETAWAPPPGPLSRTALLEYLARVQPTGTQPLAAQLATSQLLITNYLVALLPHPDDSILTPLLALKHRGIETQTIILDPASFPTGGPSGATLNGALTASGLETRIITFVTDWSTQLTDSPTFTYNPTITTQSPISSL
jgi:uncharacterized protein (DUF58 family)